MASWRSHIASPADHLTRQVCRGGAAALQDCDHPSLCAPLLAHHHDPRGQQTLLPQDMVSSMLPSENTAPVTSQHNLNSLFVVRVKN